MSSTKKGRPPNSSKPKKEVLTPETLAAEAMKLITFASKEKILEAVKFCYSNMKVDEMSIFELKSLVSKASLIIMDKLVHKKIRNEASDRLALEMSTAMIASIKPPVMKNGFRKAGTNEFTARPSILPARFRRASIPLEERP